MTDLASQSVALDYAEEKVTPLVFPRPKPETASIILNGAQKLRYLFYLLLTIFFILWDYKIAFTILNFMVCGFYAAIVCYRFICVGLSIYKSPEIKITPEEIASLRDEELPIYTILIPLYKEANIAGKIIHSICNLDYPQEKLDVKLLVESDDIETFNACKEANPPSNYEIIIVPEGSPKTKPRACNYGLKTARGKYLVIYDAEDRPERDQLKKAIIAFRNAPEDVVCFQCKLNYYNANQNWLTRFFTLEYTTWFELYLPGLHKLKVPIPLGGTSNHFDSKSLREFGGWDPHNVTEDCDLGIRVYQFGCRTLILDSTTWEEANSQLWNWVRQRSRWVKGYIQTHLVYSRGVSKSSDELGIKNGLSFLMTVGGLAAVLLLNPIYWVFTLCWMQLQWKLIYFDYTDATMQTYSAWSIISWVFFGITALLFIANIFFILINVAACWRRRLWGFLPYALISPIYWILMSLAAWKGFLQLFIRPFYWEKTMHGLSDK